MANITTTTAINNLTLVTQDSPFSKVSLQMKEAYPFHDGWNVACFIILLLFILTVLSLAALAMLYELLDCGWCAKEKMQIQPEQLQEVGSGHCSELMTSICNESESHTEVE
ncbi:small integral membrane protein 18 [Stigmatopora nigra]